MRCEDAAAQKGIFADSLTLGVLTCLTLGEMIRDPLEGSTRHALEGRLTWMSVMSEKN